MFDIYMRGVKDSFLIPFLMLLQKYKFSPNVLTVLSLIYGVIGLYFVAVHERHIGFLFCFIR